ncbi:hypothetical protein BC828DRAFT_395045 [Blastocladiella britannica]|nr:hypothetical protein BC828DRAFT_395045 [Blastocladiella britannica]
MQLLSALSLIALLATQASAAILDQYSFNFGGTGSVSPTVKNVNLADAGITSTPAANQCIYPSVADAWTNLQFSRGVFYLAPGAHSISIKMYSSPYGGGSSVAIIGTGTNTADFIDQSTIPSWAVVTNGLPNAKVQTRAAAAAICASKGMILAAPTKQTWDAVAAALQSSPAIVAPSSTVIVSSWDGNDYGGADLALTVIKGAKPSVGGLTLAAAPAYPLCQKDPSQTQTPAYQPVVMDANIAVVGPAGDASKLVDACAKVNMVPYLATAFDPTTCKHVSDLVFQASGQNSQAYIAGWNEPDNYLYAINTGATGGSCTVTQATGGSHYYVCQKKAVAKRSEL